MNDLRQFKDIPSGIKFGTKVIQLPSVQSIFSLNDRPLFWKWSWVRRGDPIMSFTAGASKTKNSFLEIFIGKEIIKGYYRSPVSGLLIHSTHVSSLTSPDECAVNHLMAILLPEDEDKPENSDFMIGDWLNTCWHYRDEWIRNK